MSLTPINSSNTRKEVEQPPTSKPSALQFVQQRISTFPSHGGTSHPSQLFRDTPAARTNASHLETLSHAHDLFEQGRFQNACNVLENTSLRDAPFETRWEYHILRGDCLAALEKNAEAKEEYNSALLFVQNPEKIASTRFKIDKLVNQALKNGSSNGALNEPVVHFEETTATLGFEDENQTATINLETGEVVDTKARGKFNDVVEQTAAAETNLSLPPPPWAIRPFKGSVIPKDSKQASLPNVKHSDTQLAIKENLLAVAFLSDEAKRCATENLKKGQSLLHTGKLDEAIECFLEGIKFASTINAPDLSLQLCRDLGYAFYRKNNIPKCILVWKMSLPFLTNDDKKLQICTSLLGIARKSNNFDLFKGIETIGLGITKATNETKTSFLFECGQMLEAQRLMSAAMEIYQSLLAQDNTSPETKQKLLAKLASLQNK